MYKSNRGDDDMFKKMNYPASYRSPNPVDHDNFKNVIENKKNELFEKHGKKFKNNPDEKMTNIDIFLTLILKNLSQDERFLLLNKLLTMDWDNPNNDLSTYLSELINKKKTDEELKETLDYEYFLWDFNNWKNYFLTGNKK